MGQQTSIRLLGADGPFAEALDGFAPRDEQLRMAEAVEDAIAGGASLVVEAGTGIGKTLAYLVPALLSGEKVIVSTGTKTLQDQLYFRDLPLVRDALESSATTALLKGRGNYLCLHRMHTANTEGRLPSREAVQELQAVRDWSAKTRDGDLSIAGMVSDESGLMPLVTSTADNCLGSECPEFDRCFVAHARREAQEADIVVVNHHLLFADMAIKQSGFGEVLPGAGAFIVDEAHQAPETASRFFSTTLSARQVQDLCRDFLAETAEVSGSMAVLREPVADCLQKLKELQLAVAGAATHRKERGTWAELMADEGARGALQALDQSVIELAAEMPNIEGRARGMDGCIERLRHLQGVFDRFDSEPEAGEVRWFELRGRGFALNITPLEVSTVFGEFRSQVQASWVFTSATLSVRSDFGHFTRRMGLEDAATLQLDSPFDYASNARLWLPEMLPEPRDPSFVPALLDCVVPLLEASHGRAFLLFTSHRALRLAAEQLAERVSFPLFVQGEQPRSLLLDRFRRSGDGVLLGSASFWEGVDVIGDALSLVVIDKLPFAAPDDPVMEARSSQLRRMGGNPFTGLYLPQAVIALKQGAGRLIRDVNDRGVLVICDPRIRSRSYGGVFLESLPPMKQALSREEAEEFLR
ncbi:MAG: ATP-dependent DNA helicase [Xanthomonadales bacterium]|nr:ATP-dependent DNA helicase [Gammaproteobacteria bacterium]MBT8057527.1 ATP-dependent DNA helicase [Gammaproteobacteria bacterium]NNL04384.1 ATP-dependent DNA helicase [Xanthomonadales bacterium]